MTATLVNRAEQAVAPGERWLKSICNSCVSNTCGMRVLVRNGKVIRAEGDRENPFNRGKLCAKAHALVFAINDPKRVRKPMKRTNPEKGIGVDPRWVEISYDEAYDLVAKALREQRQRDPRRLLTLSGGGTDFSTNQWAGPMLPGAWGEHMFLQNGGYCGHSLHFQNYYYHNAFHVMPDWKYVKYLILMGSQKGALVGHVPVTSAIEAAEARSRGVKFVSVDPLATNMTSKSHEWLPIRPGTDGALLMAWMNVLTNELGIYDADFLRTYTNAPYLIREDGHYVRDAATNKPMMWDEVNSAPKVYDDATLERPALEGKYTVQLSGDKVVRAQTAFEIFKEKVREWTPKRVSEITTIPADTIRRIAKEFGEAASIGSTIVIDGEVLPYRPAVIHWYRGLSGHSNGWDTGRILETITALVGAVDVPGGLLGEAIYVDPPGLRERSLLNGDRSGYADGGDGILSPAGGPVLARMGPRRVHIGVPEAPPLNAEGRLVGTPLGLFPAIQWMAGFANPTSDMLYPERHGKTLSRLPPETILCFFNMSLTHTCQDPQDVVKVFLGARFVACITTTIDEGAELADVIIPTAHFLERLEPFCNPETNFSGCTYDGEYYCWNIRAPVVETDIPHHWESWFELASRLDMLPDVYTTLNTSMDLRGAYRLDPERKYTWPELMDHFLQSRLGRRLDEVLKDGQAHFKWKKNVKERYPRVYFKTGRIPFYFEDLVDMRQGLDKVTRQVGIDWWDTRQYNPLPTWIPCKAFEQRQNGTLAEYDLVTVTYKVPFIQAQFGLSQPWAAELAELHPYVWKVWMNSETARRKGLADGDWVRIESQRNGRVVEAPLKVSECVHPEVIGISSHGGHWAKAFGAAVGKYMAAWPALMYASHETMDFVQGQPDHCVAVKVTRIRPST